MNSRFTWSGGKTSISLVNRGPVSEMLNSLRPRQNGRLFADDTLKRIFLNENIRISTKNSLKFVPKGIINNIPALVLIMAWRRPGDKPLSEIILVRSLTHICVTRPQWVKRYGWNGIYQFNNNERQQSADTVYIYWGTPHLLSGGMKCNSYFLHPIC